MPIVSKIVLDKLKSDLLPQPQLEAEGLIDFESDEPVTRPTNILAAPSQINWDDIDFESDEPLIKQEEPGIWPALEAEEKGWIGRSWEAALGQVRDKKAEIYKSKNAVAMAESLGITPSAAYDNLDALSKEAGLRGQPTFQELIEGTIMGGVVAGLLANPLATLIGVGVYMTLAEAENVFFSFDWKRKEFDYQFGAGKGFEELLPEDVSQGVEDLVWLIDVAWKGVLAGRVAKTTTPKLHRGLQNLYAKFVRDISTKYNLPKEVYVSPEKIREFHGRGRKDVISRAESDMLKDIGLTRQQYVDALRQGVDIRVPVEKIIMAVDKPWWGALKRVFRAKPYRVETIVRGKPTVRTHTELLDSPKEAVPKVSPVGVRPDDVVPDYTFVSKKGNAYDKIGEDWYDNKGKKVDNRFVIRAAEKGKVKYSEVIEDLSSKLPEVVPDIESYKPGEFVDTFAARDWAVVLKNGRVVIDKEAVNHLDVVERQGIDPNGVADTGFIVDGKFASWENLRLSRETEIAKIKEKKVVEPAEVVDIKTGEVWERPEHLVSEVLFFDPEKKVSYGIDDLPKSVKTKIESIGRRVDRLLAKAESEGLSPKEVEQLTEGKRQLENLYFEGKKTLGLEVVEPKIEPEPVTDLDLKADIPEPVELPTDESPFRQLDPEVTSVLLDSYRRIEKLDDPDTIVGRLKAEVNSWLDGNEINIEAVRNMLDEVATAAKLQGAGEAEVIEIFEGWDLEKISEFGEYVGEIAEWARKAERPALERGPRAYQEKYPEKTVHEDWDKANSPRYIFESAGDILREFQKDTIDPGYIGEKLGRVERFIEEEISGKIHPDDSIAAARKYEPRKLKRLTDQYKEQPVLTKAEQVSKDAIVALLEGKFNDARKLYSKIKSNVEKWAEKPDRLVVEPTKPLIADPRSVESLSSILRNVEKIGSPLQSLVSEFGQDLGSRVYKIMDNILNAEGKYPKGNRAAEILREADRLKIEPTEPPGVELYAGIPLDKVYNAVKKLLTAPRRRRTIVPEKPINPFPGVRGEAAEMVYKRAAGIGLANYETNRFANSIEQRTTSKQREVLPFVLEKTDVPKEFNRPDLQEVLERDKKHLEGVAKEIKDWFDLGWRKIKHHLPDLTTKQIEDYVTHLWDIPRHKRAEATSWFSTQNRFLERRFIPTYKEGIEKGFKPKTLDIVEIIKVHDSVSNRAIENAKYIKSLLAMKRDGISLVQRGGDAPLDWVEVDFPALTRRLYVPKKKGKPGFVKAAKVRVHPDLVRPLKAIFEERFDHPVVSAYEAMNGVMKKARLSISLFHHGALGETGIALIGLPKTINIYLNPVKIYKALVRGEFDVFTKEEVARDSIENGVQYGATADIPVARIQGYLNDLARVSADIPLANKLTWFLKEFNSVWDKALWSYLHDTLKLYGYESLVGKLDPKLDAEMTGMAKREIAQLVNDTFGGQNWDTLMITPKEVQMLTWSLLSADWTMSTTRQALAPTGIGKVYEETAGLRRKMGLRFWAKAALFFGVGMNMLNALHRNKDIEDNPQYYTDKEYSFFDKTMFGNTVGKKTYLFKGRYEDGTERYVRWGKQFRDFFELLIIPSKKLGGKAAPVPQLLSEIFTGHTLSGFKNDDVYGTKGLEKAVGILKTIARSPLPISLKKFMREDMEFKPLDIMMQSSKGMSRYTAMDYFKKAIIDGDEDLLSDTYTGALRNNLPAYTLFNSALSWAEAEIMADVAKDVGGIEDARAKQSAAESAYDKARYGRILAKLEKEKADKKAGLRLFKIAVEKARIYRELGLGEAPSFPPEIGRDRRRVEGEEEISFE